jgi:hypothetical protein
MEHSNIVEEVPVLIFMLAFVIRYLAIKDVGIIN